MPLHTLRRAATIAAVAIAAACSDAPTSARLDSARPADALQDANLLECPTNASRTTAGIIGPLGGVLTLDGFVVDIPSGAVPTPTLFSLTVPASRFMKVDVTAAGVEHYVFGAPVEVTIDYGRCAEGQTAGRALTVWHVAPITDAPLEHMGGVDDPARRRITFTTGHLSGYVIAY